MHHVTFVKASAYLGVGSIEANEWGNAELFSSLESASSSTGKSTCGLGGDALLHRPFDFR